MNTHLRIAKMLTHLLDEQFSVGKFRFGLDPVLGLFPGFGDLFSLGISFYLVFIGITAHLPQEKIIEMIKNIIIDFFIGLFPLIGDISDFFYKANKKNLQILEQHLGEDILEGEII